MAMAMEAVTQVYENHNAAFEGYRFQNLHITSPLVLPNEGDIEVLFNLKVLRQHIALKETTKWFELNVSSVTSDGKWTEHARGLIAVEETDTGILIFS